jgi:hypothetical protein
MNLQKLSFALLIILLVGIPMCWLTGNLAGKALNDSTGSTPTANPTTVAPSPTAEPTEVQPSPSPSLTAEPTSTAAPQVLPTRTPSPTPPTG